MYLSIARVAFLSLAAIGCIAITLVPHWRDLVAQDYGTSATDISQQMANKEREALEKRLAETREETGDDMLAGRYGLFLTGTYGETDRSTTRREPGFDADLIGFVVGADYRINRQTVVGAAINYQESDSDYDDRLGSLDNESIGILAYLGMVPTDNSYFDVRIGYAELDHENRRNIFADTTSPTTITDVARSDYDGYRFTAGASAGYDWYAGPYSYGPRASLDYVYTDVDASVEKSGGASAVRVDGYSKDSLQLRLGVAGSRANSFNWGVLSTQASFSYVHEFADDALTLDITNIATGTESQFRTDNPDRDIFLGSIGAVAVLPHGISVFGNVEKLFGHSYMERWTANAGVRLEFQ